MNFVQKSGISFLLKSFVAWRIGLFAILLLATRFLPHGNNFLGGGMTSYLSNPYLWSWANFDGEHYLSIAQWGYKNLQYFFFPVYPILTGRIGLLFTGNFVLSGLLISNVAFFLGLMGLWKLITLDFDKKIAKLAVILLLIFPTSFYFGSVYTEGLFFALAVWSLFWARKGNFLFAAILSGFASATRVIGIVLLPVLVAEYFLQQKGFKLKWNFLYILLAPAGILIYMYYLGVRVNDPLEFLHTISIFGPQRSDSLILLPQVFYRYFFKVMPNLDYTNFLAFYPSVLELIVALAFTVLSVYSLFKLRLSYSLYLALGFLASSLSGSFSSLPRYVLVLFPAFLLSAVWIQGLPATVRFFIYGLLFVGLTISASMFLRGYWIS